MPELDAGSNLILIIDDSVDTIRLLSSMLKDQGKILFATNGETGIRLAQMQQPTLILLDVEMAGMNGYEVCAALKTDPTTQDCAVIIVTANTGMEHEIAALEAGAVDFITKPFNPPVVRARVQTHLRLQQHTAMMRQLANRDGLTGLYNRRYLDEVLSLEFERHRRQQLPLALAIIDVDHFKAYNDHYGHPQGDVCLQSVATAISTVARRPGERVARYGGEEFAVILPHTDAAGAERYGRWLCQLVRDLQIPHQSSATAPTVTISVGLAAVVPPVEGSAQQLIAAADQALYLAKTAGRNRAIVNNWP
ncbi:diguanylate cyclase domain-containing protein [Metapseudomonas boanensis]|uniref:diguanylate cyclase n=1 Tax=Metapseudomonas boanensis TaxID=2822138 RepID=A0ABS5XI32_9GAMM|nr:diguanylate cyclase [Pseudomonas boanensis]MBT8765992.1 diguanylate cyclase [Pseudomonas boanensis]